MECGHAELCECCVLAPPAPTTKPSEPLTPHLAAGLAAPSPPSPVVLAALLGGPHTPGLALPCRPPEVNGPSNRTCLALPCRPPEVDGPVTAMDVQRLKRARWQLQVEQERGG